MKKISPYVYAGLGVKKVTFSKIQKVICSHFKVDFSDIESKSRERKFVIPRQLIAYFCKIYLDETLAEIGNLVNRDHSTVLNSIKVINNYNETLKGFSDIVGDLNSKIVGGNDD